jgi:2-polyprenyl-3-methyl-5-hydroxy-6-metoxy-1,4-benzoquinol methylase
MQYFAVGIIRERCVVCQSPRVRPFLKGSGRRLRIADIGSSREDVSHATLLRCAACGHAFAESVMSSEELAALYRGMDTRVYEAGMAARMKTAARHLAMVMRYVCGGRLVDVGCASGLFLEQAAAAGWRVTGIEPSPRLCQVAVERLRSRGRIVNAALEQADVEAASCDALTLWDVLEHVADPPAFVARCSELLKPGGFLFAKTPDVESLQARVMGKRWPLYLAEHLSYFTRRSLRLCGERANLPVVRFLRGPVTFAVEYIFFRLGQHGLPGAALAHRLVRGNALGRACLSLPLGELYTVWQKPPRHGRGDL